MTHSVPRYTVLVPVLTDSVDAETARIATMILSGRNGNLTLLGTVGVPEDVSLSTATSRARECRTMLDAIDAFDESHRGHVQRLVKVARSAWDAIRETIKEGGFDVLVLPWPAGCDNARRYGVSLVDVINDPPIDVVIVKSRPKRDGSRVLLTLRGRAHTGGAVNAASAVSRGLEAGLTITRILDKGESSAGIMSEEFVLKAGLASRGINNGDYELITTSSYKIATKLSAFAADHDVVVIGVPSHADAPVSSAGKGVQPTLDEAVINEADALALLAASSAASLEPVLPAADDAGHERGEPSQRAVLNKVDKWFAENTFHCSEFEDIGALVDLKRKQGLTVSLGLPTLNEGETIGRIIEVVKGALVDQYPLIDELAIIDSESTDGTVEIAEGLGVKIYKDSEILPAWGSRLGKGNALWKSLYALNGDIIAWIDTDIKNIDPRFVYGLVGPLIKYPGVKYVKGFYRRPLNVGDRLIETGGGRVTELTARPLLNLFFPELSGLIQPLSGEYAGRRDVLERVGFYTGYGIEMGLLINILEQFGLDAIGQVDLIERVHRNQSLANLSKMAFAIIQVVMDSLEQRHLMKLLGEMNKTMKLMRQDAAQLSLENKAIEDLMNPPMITLPEYREKFEKQIVERGLSVPDFPDMPLTN